VEEPEQIDLDRSSVMLMAVAICLLRSPWRSRVTISCSRGVSDFRRRGCDMSRGEPIRSAARHWHAAQRIHELFRRELR